jgi:hypothetical protein
MTDQLNLGLDPRAELDAKITRLLFPTAGETSPLSEEERRLLLVLQKHMGHDNAIWISRLTERLDLSPREIKAAARNLVVKLGLPVVGSRQAPYGYYLAITPEELLSARNVLLSEVKALASRLVALGESEGRIIAHIHLALKGEHEGDAA